MKALQIFTELKKVQPSTVQITHGRNREELEGRLKLPDIHFVDDTWVSRAIWRTRVLRFLIDYWFFRRAVRLAERIAAEMGVCGDDVVVHQTEPNSPVLPRIVSRTHLNVFGPINGNIYYPAIFRRQEGLGPRVRRVLHFPLQRINRLLFNDLSRADLIFVAGGNRTTTSLQAAGCSEARMVNVVDCGVPDALLNRPRVVQRGINLRFVHYGRLVFHKGTALIIASLAKTRHQVELDIVGAGPELDSCKRLVKDLGLDARVRFVGWYTSHDDLIASFSTYRGMVLPSIEDANGIVVQEAMALGLPPVCLDWGGPQLLIDHGRTGFLVEPRSVEFITSQIADHLDRLSQDGELAEQMSRLARERAEEWRWSRVAEHWMELLAGLRRAYR